MKESEIKDLIISPMSFEDIEEASLLEGKVFSMPWKASDFAEMIEASYAFYITAKLDGLLVGICGFRDIAGEGEITNVAVDPAYRRRGVARAMLSYILEHAGKENISDITLEVRVGNKAAISLYESFGFAGEGVRPNFYEKPKEDALIMWKHR